MTLKKATLIVAILATIYAINIIFTDYCLASNYLTLFMSYGIEWIESVYNIIISIFFLVLYKKMK